MDGVVVGAVCGTCGRADVSSTADDADAAKKRPLRTLWAVIQPDGLTYSYKGLTGNQKTATGKYQIDFNRDISKCAYTATISDGYIGYIGTQNAGPQSVRVFTNKPDTNSSDMSFYLVVNC